MGPRTAIVDIDETLVHTYTTTTNDIENGAIWDSSPELRAKTYRLIFDNGEVMYGVTRPGYREFLKSLFEEFDQVVVWSAGTADYVDYLVSYLFSGLPKPHDVLSREHCQKIDDDLHKPIRYLRRRGLVIDPRNTVIFDDRVENFLANPKNGILMPAYKPPTTIRGLCMHKDDYLFRLVDWIKSSDFKTSIFSYPRLCS
jgi:hypothetical protein